VSDVSTRPEQAPPPGNVPQQWSDRLASYRNEIGAAKRFMEQRKYHKKWQHFVRIYSENTQKTSDANVDAIDVAITFANVNVQRSALTVNNPKFTINPRNFKSAPSAAVCEEVMNYEWYHNNYQDQIKTAVDDFLIMGNSWLKTRYVTTQIKPEGDVDFSGYGTGFDYGAFEAPGFRQTFDKTLEAATKMISQNPAGPKQPVRSGRRATCSSRTARSWSG